MKNETKTQEREYYNGVLTARVKLNEIKLIQPKQKSAKAYCAINLTIFGEDEKGNTYTNIDCTVRGKAAKALLWEYNEDWPANRFEQDEDQYFFADVRIGSLDHCGFERKNGEAGAVLKGRLIHISALKIGDNVVYGEMDEDLPTTFVAPAIVNEINYKKGFMKASLLEGKVGNPEYKSIRADFDQIDVFDQMKALNKYPKGYENRDTNPSVFAVLNFSEIKAVAYKNKKTGECLSYLSGKLSEVRYLRLDDEVLVSFIKKEEQAEFPA